MEEKVSNYPSNFIAQKEVFNPEVFGKGALLALSGYDDGEQLSGTAIVTEYNGDSLNLVFIRKNGTALYLQFTLYLFQLQDGAFNVEVLTPENLPPLPSIEDTYFNEGPCNLEEEF